MKTPMSISNSKKTTLSAEKLPKAGGFAMASSRPSLKPPPKKPSTPATPRVAAARTTTPTPTHTLHPTVTAARSPRLSSAVSSAARPRADSSIAPDDPSPAFSSRSHVATVGRKSPGASDARGPRYVAKPQQPFNHTGQASPRFFHASDVNPPSQPSQAPTSAPSAKFFTADSLKPGGPLSSGSSPSPHVSRPARSSLGTPSIVSPPSSRPASMVAGPTSNNRRPSRISVGEASKRPPPLTQATAPEARGHVKFVYANGTEEILSPRDNKSEVGSVTSSPPQLPSMPSSPRLYSLPVCSPGKHGFSQSPLASPNTLAHSPQFFAHTPQTSSGRSSMEGSRHERNPSIDSALENMHLSLHSSHPDSGHGSEDGASKLEERTGEISSQPPLQTAAERIKAMEEAAADARRERKVMDLEISNASLMAINKTLEREMRKQTAELRRYRRLSRSGRLSLVPSHGVNSSISSAITLDTNEETDGWEKVANSEGEEDDEDEEEEDEDEDIASEDEDAEGIHDEKHRVADERRLALDMSKHQALLDASAKMNVSLKRCSYMADQMIAEARRALEYKVRPSDVRLGGRILEQDEETETDASSIAPSEASTAPSDGLPTPRLGPADDDAARLDPNEYLPI